MCLILLPAHSPAAPQPHAYSTIPTASPVTPPPPPRHPSASSTLWIQSKSTPGRLFDIKASLTETVRKKEGGGNVARCFVRLQAALELHIDWLFLYCRGFF